VLIFGQRFDLIFGGYTERAAVAWRAHRASLDAQIATLLAGAAGRSRAAVWKELQDGLRLIEEDA